MVVRKTVTEWLSLECRKTKTKQKQTKTPGNHWFVFLLVRKVTRLLLTNYRVVKQNQSKRENYVRHSIEQNSLSEMSAVSSP